MGNRSVGGGLSEVVSGPKAYHINQSEEYHLGSGGFAKVYRITRKSDQRTLAMKVSLRN
jgi:NIMA (never in mitosis gene a)-related kinase 1/4/5